MNKALAILAASILGVVIAASLNTPDRERAVRYALMANAQGVPQPVIVQRIISATGWPIAAVTEGVAAAIGTHGRDPDSIRTIQVGAFVANARVAEANTVLSAAWCSPFLDESDTSGHAQCLADNANFLGERWCLANGTDVARGGRLWLTQWQRQLLGAALSGLSLGAQGETVLNADSATYFAAAAARNIQRCEAPIQ